MNKIQKLVKESIQGYKVKKSCSCGCNTCEDKRPLAPILNESMAPREILSEGLKYHIDTKKPLTENVYRAGSENYFNLWSEARALYSRGILEIQNQDDLEILNETNLGEFGILEDGTKVPLDFPILEEETTSDYEVVWVDRNYNKFSKKFKNDPLGPPENAEVKAKKFIKSLEDKDKKSEYGLFRDIKLKSLSGDLTESKENKPIGKPMRGGSKKFYVYVRDPKTKKIKKVSFGGTTGLSVKINDPKARKAFAARHDCKNKKDRTKPSYWSCNIGKYWKQLGGEKNFSGFW